MKPIIGIIMRSSVSESNLPIKYIYDDVSYAIYKSGGIPIGIDPKYIDNYLKICQGFIIPGGNEVVENDLLAIKKITETDLPLLGICLGMQEVAYLNSGTITDIINHKIEGLHEIIIKHDSLLYKILGCEKTLVNSRHKSAIVSTRLTVSAISYDNVIEAVEDNSKKFLLGIEWHPENMYDKEINARKIFDYFIKICNDSNR